MNTVKREFVPDLSEVIAKIDTGIQLSVKSNGEPLWRQLYSQITDLIAEGKLDSGMGLPSERELAELLQISRGTVRRCYAELRANQQLSSGQGRGGSKLQDPSRVHPTLGHLKSFTQEMAELGKVASTKIEYLAVIQSEEMAEIFQRPKDAQFLHVIRIRYGDDTPMSREIAWYDLQQAPNLRHWKGQGSVYEYLRQYCGINLGKSTQTVEATLSNPQDNLAFNFEDSQPCLLFKRHVYSRQHQQLIEYVEGTFRGDLYVYSLNLY